MPIVVGVIGLVGVIVGQLINTWRENRNWKREQAREDARWQREIELEQSRSSVADRAHWRDKKFEVYSELLAFMKLWLAVLYDASGKVFSGERVGDGVESKLHEFIRNHLDHRDKIELIATDKAAQRALLDTLNAYDMYTRQILEGDFLENEGAHGRMNFSGDVDEIINDVIVAIRVDLGISHDEDVTYSPHVKRLKVEKKS